MQSLTLGIACLALSWPTPVATPRSLSRQEAEIPCRDNPLSHLLERSAPVVSVVVGAVHRPAMRAVAHAGHRLPGPVVANPCHDTTLIIVTGGRNSLSQQRILCRDRDTPLSGQIVSQHQALWRHRASRALSR